MHQLPELDEVTKAKIRRLLTAGMIFLVMNDTKWAELIKALINAPQMQSGLAHASIRQKL